VPASMGKSALITLSCIGLLVGCTASRTPAADQEAVGAPSPGVTAVGVDAQRDPLQDELLADGAVSTAEMERALLAVVTCVQQSGHSAELVEFNEDGGGQFQTSGATTEEADAAEAALDRCRAEILSDVQPAYNLEHAPSEQEIQEHREKVVDCLVGMGHDVAGLSANEASELVPLPDYIACDESAP